MSLLRFGTSYVTASGQLKLGSSNVTAAYIGSTKVFPAYDAAPSRTQTTGTYPVSSAGNTNDSTYANNTGATVYLYVVYNSGGNNSGTFNSSGLFSATSNWGSPDQTISLSGTITSSGQTFTSSTYYTLTQGSSIPARLSLASSPTSGPTLKMGWATSIGGAVTLFS